MTALDGVRWGKLTAHADARGSFREIWKRSAFPALAETATGRPDAAFVQANISTSSAGVLRGMHYHRRQLDHWVVLGGRAFVALVDVEQAAAGRGRTAIATRELAQDDTVTIPVGVAHGFLALEPLQLMYLVTNEYDGTDELGFAWDDAAVGIDWPTVRGNIPTLSDRDRRNPTLLDLFASLPR
jgi:dTDP-4-dehydrorhamnose 3,5-epimerase